MNDTIINNNNIMENNDKKYLINTYGCQMNIHESEQLAGMLEKLGYSSTQDPNLADVIVFNTCCIRENAEQKTLGNIGDIKRIKRNNPNLIVAVVGCMTQQEGVAEKIKKRFPFVNIFMGTNNLQEFEEAVKIIADKQKKTIFNINEDQKAPICEEIPQYRTSGTNAWVNIIYGCDNFCSYCIVPFVRGRERSRKPELIIDEVRSCLDSGYKEVTLLGQNVDSYSYENYDFCYLLEQIAKIDGKFRLRF
ncbi:MAG: radical SAM protein, partial [Clostridia bacterium]